MHRSSETIASLAAALAKAQMALTNPEKSLTGTLPGNRADEPGRTFRHPIVGEGPLRSFARSSVFPSHPSECGGGRAHFRDLRFHDPCIRPLLHPALPHPFPAIRLASPCSFLREKFFQLFEAK